LSLGDPHSVIDKHLKQLNQNTFLFSYRVPKHLRQNNHSLPSKITKRIITSDKQKAMHIAMLCLFEVELMLSV
jgi:hypothetical protein